MGGRVDAGKGTQASARPDPPAARVALIVAVAENGVIGRGDAIPWRLRDDQLFFKRMTLGHALVMGRATWESFGKPLSGRTSVVLTRNRDFSPEGALVAHDFETALELAAAHPPAPPTPRPARPPERPEPEGTVFVIGGAAVYDRALPVAHTAYVTRVHAEVEGDVRFDAFCGGAPPGWIPVAEERHEADARNEYAFTIETWRREGGAG